MKYIILSITALSVLSVMLGVVYKIQSWPGGGIFLLAGMVILPAIAIALTIFTAWKNDTPDAVLDLDPDKVPDTVEEAEQLLRDEDNMIL